LPFDQQQQAAAFVLFSVWLPVAPHVHQLVSQLFDLPNFEFPLAKNSGKPAEVFLLVEAAHGICRFYCKHRQHKTLATFWNWSPLFRYVEQHDASNSRGAKRTDSTTMSLGVEIPWLSDAIQWHAVRAAAFSLNVSSARKADYYEKYGVQEEQTPWNIHPWEIDNEETVQQALQLRHPQPGARIWDDNIFSAPLAKQMRAFVSLHPYLVEVSPGQIFAKHRGVQRHSNNMLEGFSPHLIHTETTNRNLMLLGTAMCIDPNPPPVLVCGPPGSGKSSLIRELARLFNDSCNEDSLLVEIHIDDETDSKTLIGSYTTADVPGQFEWRPGALAQAVQLGKWVLLEDVDRMPVELQASFVQLLESRLLPPKSNGKLEACHPNFRLFGTSSALPAGRPSSTTRQCPGDSPLHILHQELWKIIHVEPLPLPEIKDVVTGLYSHNMPGCIIDATLNIFQVIDFHSGRKIEAGSKAPQTSASGAVVVSIDNLWISNHFSVRDLFKVFSRIHNGIEFELDAQYVTENHRMQCLAEAADVFVAGSSKKELQQYFVQMVAAPCYGVAPDAALMYLQSRSPEIHVHKTLTVIGRAKIPVSTQWHMSKSERASSDHFVITNHTLRLMEAVGVCIQENEPVLLVGETGCGKTTVLQQMAKLSGQELIVQNLSLQTDSTDLLGGYRPLEMQFVATKVYQDFVDLFVSTFSRKQNAQFLSFAASALKKAQWKKFSQCLSRAAEMGLSRVKERGQRDTQQSSVKAKWEKFSKATELFEQQRLACGSGMAFVFTEGALVEAVQKGKWVLLDEINLASPETLQRLCGLLDDRHSSLTITERGDANAIERHPEFRLFAAMNPATDAGKKELSESIRCRFTEIYVTDVLDPQELQTIAGGCLTQILPVGCRPPEHSGIVIDAVNLYLLCRQLAETSLVGGNGHRPCYTLRTFTHALSAARAMVLEQNFSLKRGLCEGFELAFQGSLDVASTVMLKKTLHNELNISLSKKEMDHPCRRPGRQDKSTHFVLVKPFWIKLGPVEPEDWSESPSKAHGFKFILTPSMLSHLRQLARAIAAGPWPILLEGPTSAGKTTLIEYLAARCGYHIIRINNHEHTDIQEYTGGFSADSNGALSFQDGLLVHALRYGHWVILDELNLAPTEVLEALNRLLDDNRELYLPETNETIQPHPNFRLFATQNPSGAYGGRKPLSRAFRSRFVEIYVGDIPALEAATILEERCSCPSSHAKVLVSIMESLRQRRSTSGIFLGKDGYITPRDLLKWANRGASSKLELAQEGYMLLAERLRTAEEKQCVQEVMETHLNVKIDIESIYYGEASKSQRILAKATESSCTVELIEAIAPTKSMLKMMTLILRCIDHREPVLLVGG